MALPTCWPLKVAIFLTATAIVAFAQAQLQAQTGPAAVTTQPKLKHSQHGNWSIAESDNFRFFHRNQHEVVGRLVTVCESSRQLIRKRWLPEAGFASWTPKCDVYLYPSAQEFQQQTRFPAASWGFADMEIGQGKVWMRRLNMRSDVESRLTAVIIHELTHIVLADRFAHQQIPRWADEGIALNSEPPQRQQDLRRWLAEEVRQGRGYSLTQLLNVKQCPQDKYLGDLFYAQSGSLIEFLIQHQPEGEHGVLRLIERTQVGGIEGRQHNDSVTRLETVWRDWIVKSDGTATTPGEQLASDRP